MNNSIKSIFIVDGRLDRPILHSQGLPLIRHLQEDGFCNWIVSFEGEQPDQKGTLWQDLIKHGIVWIPICIGSEITGPKRTQFILRGILEVFKRYIQEQIDVVHCRSYRPAVIGYILKKVIGAGFLFDMRGFLIDEQLILGRWQPSGIKYWIARRLEQVCLLNADFIVANSIAFKEAIEKFSYFPSNAAERIAIIPNSVDTFRFRPDTSARMEIRRELGWINRLVVVFVGECRSWESFSQMIDWFNCLKVQEPKALIAFYVYGDYSELDKILRSKLSSSDYFLRTIPSEKIPIYLSASDIGILFRNTNLYTRAVPSPIKFGEYLACGLPVVTNGGIGDTDRIINQYNVGTIVHFDNPIKMVRSVTKILNLVQQDPDIRKRCIVAAKNELSLEAAVSKYEELYIKIALKKRQKQK
jgi:glycosyltransferase involved in cell wall biosynthesis